MEAISLRLARQIALHAQGLGADTSYAAGRQGVLEVFDQLGYVQIDSISVIQRAHLHTLWSRLPDFQPEHLHALHERDREVFEYWRGSAASYLPIADYRFYRAHMQRYAASEAHQSWAAANRSLVDGVLGRLREEGALTSAQFTPPKGFVRGTWWSRTPAKIALERLFTAGIVAVRARKGFARVYDLAERVLPADVSDTIPSTDELADFALGRALRSFGIISEAEAGWSVADAAAARNALQRWHEAGRILPVSVQGLDGMLYYTAAGALEYPHGERDNQQVHLLDPFDSLIISRPRLRQLFGYDYHLECYLPAARRKIGYYSLPILAGDTFIGQADLKADRKARTLIIRNLVLEAEHHLEQFGARIAAKLHELARFNRCDTIVIERSSPVEAAFELERLF